MPSTAAMDMALDDVIAMNSAVEMEQQQSNKQPRQEREKSERRGLRGGEPRLRTRPIPRGDLNSTWKHDLFVDDDTTKEGEADGEKEGKEEEKAEDKEEKDGDQTVEDAAQAMEVDEQVPDDLKNDQEVVDTKKTEEEGICFSVVVENLHFEVDETELRNAFNGYEGLKKVIIDYDEAGRPAGTAQIHFEHTSTLQKVVEEMDGKELMEQKVTVKRGPVIVPRLQGRRQLSRRLDLSSSYRPRGRSANYSSLRRSDTDSRRDRSDWRQDQRPFHRGDSWQPSNRGPVDRSRPRHDSYRPYEERSRTHSTSKEFLRSDRHWRGGSHGSSYRRRDRSP
jgi:RNA recognition motif-containing protein